MDLNNASFRQVFFPLWTAFVWAACTTTPPVAIQHRVSEGKPVEVKTTEGLVLGATEDGIHVFKGIPYAAPVAGLDRWRPPKAPLKRKTTFDARQYGPACEQTVAVMPRWILSEAGEIATIEMGGMELHAAEEKSSDCLRLNIWTPKLGSAATVETRTADEAQAPAKPATATPGQEDAALERPTTEGSDEASTQPTLNETPKIVSGLPVMVMLHGGGLAMASAASKAQAGSMLARKGALVVGINYRLGPIGFLAGDGLFDKDVLQGNRGMMDTVQALHWIKNNIAQFGGDPNNVTLMGQSGGGTNVWAVLASPSSKGLVKRAIIMSGPINHVSVDDHKKLTRAVLEKWNVPLGDSEALAQVSTKDATSTVNATTLTGSDEFGELSRMYLPNTAAVGTEFLPDDVFTAIKKGRLDGIDLMVGNCDDDAKASLAAVPLPDGVAIDLWNGFIGGLIADTKEGETAMAQKYVDAMPESTELRAKEQLQTDALYRLRSLKAAALHSERANLEKTGRAYAYQFNWKSPAAKGKLGAIHGLDLIFAFGNLQEYPTALDIQSGTVRPSVQQLSDAMGDAWVSFAATGVPTSEALPKWPKYDVKKRHTMVFDEETAVVEDPRGKLRQLWE